MNKHQFDTAIDQVACIRLRSLVGTAANDSPHLYPEVVAWRGTAACARCERTRVHGHVDTFEYTAKGWRVRCQPCGVTWHVPGQL